MEDRENRQVAETLSTYVMMFVCISRAGCHLLSTPRGWRGYGDGEEKNIAF